MAAAAQAPAISFRSAKKILEPRDGVASLIGM
jgi:hypothetical protein